MPPVWLLDVQTT